MSLGRLRVSAALAGPPFLSVPFRPADKTVACSTQGSLRTRVREPHSSDAAGAQRASNRLLGRTAPE